MYEYSQSPDEEVLQLHIKVKQRISDITNLPEGTDPLGLEVELETKLEEQKALEEEMKARDLARYLK
ncbi:hypothetical protein D3C87_906310 [compost metagenome]